MGLTWVYLTEKWHTFNLVLVSTSTLLLQWRQSLVVLFDGLSRLACLVRLSVY